MQDHLVLIATARPVGELPRLVRVHRPLGIINIYEDIALLLCWRRLGHWMWGFGGAHALAFIAYVDPMGFL